MLGEAGNSVSVRASYEKAWPARGEHRPAESSARTSRVSFDVELKLLLRRTPTVVKNRGSTTGTIASTWNSAADDDSSSTKPHSDIDRVSLAPLLFLTIV